MIDSLPRHSRHNRPGNAAAEQAAFEALSGKTPEQIYFIRPDLIEPDESQPRKVFDAESLQSLAQSLAVEQQQPITVTRLNGGRYRIVTGERRWRAAQLGKLEGLWCRIVEGVQAQKILETQLEENIERDELRIGELCASIYRLKAEFGATFKYLADNTFYKYARGQQKWVENRYYAWARTKEMPEVRELLLNHADTLTHVGVIYPVEEKALRLKLVEMAANGSSVQALRDEISLWRAENTPPAPPVTTRNPEPTAAPPTSTREIIVAPSPASLLPIPTKEEIEAEVAQWQPFEDAEPAYDSQSLSISLSTVRASLERAKHQVLHAKGKNFTPLAAQALETQLDQIEAHAKAIREMLRAK